MLFRNFKPSLFGAASFIVLCTIAGPASAHDYKVLYAFCSETNCADGSAPNSLIADSSDNLYGTVYKGGLAGFGGIFELAHTHDGYIYKLLYSFCQQTNCTDGGFPTGGLIRDKSGNLYGTALIGGSQGNGEVFELVRSKKSWTLQVLYGFCPQAHNCTDGVGPDSGLAYMGRQSGKPYDGTSPLFGTTDGGGNSFVGVAYEIAPGQSGWSEQVIWSFCAQQNCADGSDPSGTLTTDSSGNLYGTTIEGGAKSSGAAFELTSANGSWSENVLYSFCSLTSCTDGASPHGGLTLDQSGNLHGVTLEGGASCSIDPKGCGVAYAIAPRQSQETVQHVFCNTKCSDGAAPQGTSTADSEGNLYATTEYGGDAKNISNGGGTLYELSGSTLQVLHKFCVESACADGGQPTTAPVLVIHPRGRLFGTATTGGTNDGGVVYQFEK